MIAHREEKLNNAICFFASEHKKNSGTHLTQTYLYKYLAFLDFLSVKEFGVPSFDLCYRAMERGPVPIEIYNKRDNLKTPLFEFVAQEKNIYIIRSKSRPNLDYFSAFELDLMSGLIKKYAKKGSRTDEISDDSHETLDAWKQTYKTKKNGIIDYRLTFKHDKKLKTPRERSRAEENLNIYLALKSSAKCSRVR